MFVIRVAYPGGHSVWLTRRFPTATWGPEKDALPFPTEADAARVTARLRPSGPVTIEPIPRHAQWLQGCITHTQRSSLICDIAWSGQAAVLALSAASCGGQAEGRGQHRNRPRDGRRYLGNRPDRPAGAL
jgi:hypothetical protein